MSIIRASIVLLAVLLLLTGCKVDDNGNGNGDEPPAENPIPVLTSISPTSKVAHLPSFTLTAEGSDFVDGAVIVFKGVERETTFVDSTELTCVITPEDTALQHYEAEMDAPRANALVLVRNPLPGGGDSNSLDFTIKANHEFTDEQSVSSEFEQSYHLAILVEPEGGVNVVFSNLVDYFPQKLYMRRSSDGGDSWGDLLEVTKNPENMPAWPELAMNGDGDFYCLHSRELNGRLYFHRSNDGGQTWTTPVQVADYYIPVATHNTNAEMVVDSQGAINVVVDMNEVESSGGNIFFTRSLDGGAVWSEQLRLSEMNAATKPAIALDSQDNIYAVYLMMKTGHSVPSWYVHLRRSSNGGAQWTTGININEGYGGYTYAFPSIGVNPVNDHIYAVWDSRKDRFYGKNQVYFSRSTDRGATWSAPMNISADPDRNHYPEMVVDAAGNINVIWSRSGGLWFRRSTNGGDTWSQTVQVSETGRNTYWSRLAVDPSGNIKILWRSNMPSDYQIYFCRSE